MPEFSSASDRDTQIAQVLPYFPQVGRRICAQFPGCEAAV
jgi:hypothetical protein